MATKTENLGLTNPSVTDKYDINVFNNNNNIIDNKFNEIGTIISNEAYSISCTQGKSNNLVSISLPAGVWVVRARFQYEGSDLRYWFGVGPRGAISAYDSAGWVNGTVCDIISSTSASTITASLWPSDKDITVSAWIDAVRIK